MPTHVYGTFPASTGVPTEDQTTSPCSAPRSRSLLSRLFFAWATYLVDISKTRALRAEDFRSMSATKRSATINEELLAHEKSPRDFVQATWRLHWRYIVWSGVLALVGAVGEAVNVMVLYVLIGAATRETVVSSSMMIAALLATWFGIKFVSQLARVHSQCLMSIVATRAIGALQAMVLDATLSSSSSHDVAASQPSNLFYGLSAVHHAVLTIHARWISPLSLIVNLYLLYYLLGKAVLGSVAVAALLLVCAFVLDLTTRTIGAYIYEHRGRRLQIVSSCVQAMQSIKLHAWEHHFLDKIRAQRVKERYVFGTVASINSVFLSVLIVLPECLLAGSLAALIAMSESAPRFNPAMVFAALMVFNQTKFLLGDMISLQNLRSVATLMLNRVYAFLETSQSSVRPDATVRETTIGSDQDADHHQHCAVRLQNATIGHPRKEPSLIMVNLTIPIGSLTVVHGATGAGKSSLLEAMIEHTLVINGPRGSVHVQGRIAYCSQDPWLQTLSIRDNILFGLPYDEHKYLNVLHACCLLRDVAALRHGDKTVIGSKGLTLSGGQKARIALARACYADADVYLLDSPLASVDAIVQSDIFRRCIIDLLKHKTIVLVTHNMEVVSSPFVDQVVLVKDNRVLLGSLPPQSSAQSNRRSLTTPSRRLVVASSTKHLPATAPTHPISSELCLFDIGSTRLGQEWRHMESKRNSVVKPQPSTQSNPTRDPETTPFRSALRYVRVCGNVVGFLLPLIVLYELSCAAMIAGHLWIYMWTKDDPDPRGGTSKGLQNLALFAAALGTCCVLALVGSVFTYARTGTAADTLFDRMVRGVLFAPMTFFYGQPIGEILNRFSVDVRALDDRMAMIIPTTIVTVVGMVLQWLMLMYIVPELLCITPVVLWLLYETRHHMKIATETKALALSNYTPCFEAISEAMDGRHVIQAFGSSQVARFRQVNVTKLEKLLMMNHATVVVQCWSTLQFSKVDALLLLVLIVGVVVRQDVMPPLLGLALYYVATVSTNTSDIQALASEWGSALSKIRNVEDYGSILPEQSEHEAARPLVQLPTNWPSKGDIVFDNVSFQYDDLSGPVLQHIQLHIAPGEKIGLVGRTGAGKSSLTMALFRIHELVAGRILIDGVDIALADVYSVRSRLSIIPQSPLFFQGTLRSYLDPFGELDDVALWESLRKTGLAAVVTRMDGKLLAQLQENAENLSLGERQLLCLSRVLLKRSRVVVLDEATAAIDHESDEALQRVLKSEFQQATVISIAHRLDSIMAFDRVVVMEDGRIVQCGTVEELVGEANGPFFDLLEGALLKM